jgi:hypothetical protein
MTEDPKQFALTSVNDALKKFKIRDGKDFQKYKFGERAFTHRLAHYLSPPMETRNSLWRVDCEYNRSGKDPKRAHGAPQRRTRELLSKAKKIIETDRDRPAGCPYAVELKLEVQKLLAQDETEMDDKQLDIFILEMQKWGDVAGHLLYPDVVVHKRGSNDWNFLAMEVKIEESDPELIAFDRAKLDYFTASDGLGYQFGLFMNVGFDCRAICAYLYSDGESEDISEYFNKQGISA